MKEQPTSNGLNLIVKIITNTFKYSFYLITAIMVSLALFKIGTGINPIFGVKQKTLHTQEIVIKTEPSYNSETNTLGEERGTITITKLEVADGFQDTSKVLVLYYTFTSANDKAKGYSVLSENLKFKTEDGKDLDAYLLNEGSDKSLIDSVNNSILPTKNGDSADLAAVFKLEDENVTKINIYRENKKVDEIEKSD